MEGLFGTVKTAYGLDRVMARLQETAVCVIGVALLLSNLSLSLRAALALFCLMLLLFVLLTLRSRAYVCGWYGGIVPHIPPCFYNNLIPITGC